MLSPQTVPPSSRFKRSALPQELSSQHWRMYWRAAARRAGKGSSLQRLLCRGTPLPKPRAQVRFLPGALRELPAESALRSRRRGQPLRMGPRRRKSSSMKSALSRAAKETSPASSGGTGRTSNVRLRVPLGVSSSISSTSGSPGASVTSGSRSSRSSSVSMMSSAPSRRSGRARPSGAPRRSGRSRRARRSETGSGGSRPRPRASHSPVRSARSRT